MRIISLNLHKGFSSLNTRLVIHELKEALEKAEPDLVFLQEVVGEHRGHSANHKKWPTAPQYEFLADTLWSDFSYAKNAVYPLGHHGNAILSRYPILSSQNINLTHLESSQRGLLHCQIKIPNLSIDLQTLCVHLGLLEGERKKQIQQIRKFIEEKIPKESPLVLAGDFNDWRGKAHDQLAKPLGLFDAFDLINGKLAKSYPSRFPLLSLDRIYVRGLRPTKAKALKGKPWNQLSDHIPLMAEISF